MEQQIRDILTTISHRCNHEEEWNEYIECMDEEELEELRVEVNERINELVEDIVGHEDTKDLIERSTTRLLKYGEVNGPEVLLEKFGVALDKMRRELKEENEFMDSFLNKDTSVSDFDKMEQERLDRQLEWEKAREDRKLEEKKLKDQRQFELAPKRTFEEVVSFYEALINQIDINNKEGFGPNIFQNLHSRALSAKLIQLKKLQNNADEAYKIVSDLENRMAEVLKVSHEIDKKREKEQEKEKRAEKEKKEREKLENEALALKRKVEHKKNMAIRFRKELEVMQEETDVNVVIEKCTQHLNSIDKEERDDDFTEIAYHLIELMECGDKLVSTIKDKEERISRKRQMKEIHQRLSKIQNRMITSFRLD